MVFDPDAVSYDALLKRFWEAHDPTQGMRQGNDVGTQYRSGIYTTSAARQNAALASRDRYQTEPERQRFRRDHHRDRRGSRLLLRRAVPPAVPRQEPERLLRHRRHRGVVPHRCDLGRLTPDDPDRPAGHRRDRGHLPAGARVRRAVGSAEGSLAATTAPRPRPRQGQSVGRGAARTVSEKTTQSDILPTQRCRGATGEAEKAIPRQARQRTVRCTGQNLPHRSAPADLATNSLVTC